MELKPGFKQTEAGVIPEDWETKRLGELFDFTNGRPHEAHLKEGGRFSLITLDSIDINGSLKRTHKQTDAWDNSLRKSDLVAVLSDLAKGDLLGLCDLIPEDNLYVLNQRMGRLRARALVNSYFARLQINSRQSHFKARSQGSAQRHVYRRDFDTLSIPCPTVQEQSSIANALLDIDAMRISLEEIISKKRLIKQAAMQELLTGKRRLPGFEGEWEVKTLRDLGEIRSGGTPSTSQPAFWDGGIPWCTPTDITALDGRKYLTATARTISPSGLQGSSAEIIPSHSLIMTTRATIGECAINGLPMTTNQGFKSIVPNSSVGTEFLYYLMTTQKQRLVSLCGGSTFLEIGKKELSGYEIKLPLDRDEQDAIASMLSGMDEELQALEVNVTKAGNLKRGMMHQLLTGKIRLT
jgi:type I restriction enzyme S subunit